MSDSMHATQPESGLDWGELWATRYGREDGVEDEAYWDKRSRDFACHGGSADDEHATADPGSYARAYLERAGLLPGETVIDMGCGTGTLALPLAGTGHHVTACDLSGGMLARLGVRADAAGVADLIDVRKLSWLDEWSDLPVADVFVASRSFYARDLQRAILKMEAHARRRVCLTVATNEHPMRDTAMLAAIGRTPEREPQEYVYLFNMLAQMGRQPEVSFISHVKPTPGRTPEEIRAEFERESGPFTPSESDLLDVFIRENFDFDVPTAADGTPGRPRRRYVQHVRWAFVAWNVGVRG